MHTARCMHFCSPHLIRLEVVLSEVVLAAPAGPASSGGELCWSRERRRAGRSGGGARAVGCAPARPHVQETITSNASAAHRLKEHPFAVASGPGLHSCSGMPHGC